MRSEHTRRTSYSTWGHALLLLALCCASNLYVFAQTTNTLEPRNFKITESPLNDLLSQKSVRELFQDSYGFIWIRTQDGIHRYDGYELRTFPPNQGGLGTLGHGSGRQIIEDQSGNIWIATLDKGPAYYDIYAKDFRAIFDSSEGAPAQSKSGLDISSLYRDTDGYIWLGHLDGTIQRLNPITKKVVAQPKLNGATGLDRRIHTGLTTKSLGGRRQRKNLSDAEVLVSHMRYAAVEWLEKHTRARIQE